MNRPVYDNTEEMSHKFYNGSGSFKAFQLMLLKALEHGDCVLLKLEGDPIIGEPLDKEFKPRFREEVDTEKIGDEKIKLEGKSIKEFQQLHRSLDAGSIYGIYSISVFHGKKRIFQSIIHEIEIMTEFDIDWNKGGEFITELNHILSEYRGHIFPKKPIISWRTNGKSFDMIGPTISNREETFRFTGYKPILDKEKHEIKFEETELKKAGKIFRPHSNSYQE